jgi:histidinol-phosphate aminotransferase
MIHPNKHLLDIHRVTDNMGERVNYVRLDRNERVSPVSQEVFREMLETLSPDTFCAYPDPTPLYERLSRQLELPVNHFYLTNGSDAAIRMLFQTYLHSGDLVVFPDPTYAMYSIYSQIFQAKAEPVPYSADMTLDVDKFFELLSKHPRILAIPNPDQPTGCVLPETVLRELAAASSKSDTLFIIDEAYYPFYPHTAVRLVRDFANVVITRTFSKVGGLAGLRLGYFVANPDIVGNVQRIRGAHEVNAISVAVGSYILDHPDLAREYLDEIEAGRDVLEEAALDLKLGFPNCPANFQLLRFTGLPETAPVVAALKSKGYLVKGNFSSPSVHDCIRITLAGPDIMMGFSQALRAVVAEMNWKP